MTDTIFSILVDMAERERDQQQKRIADAEAHLRSAEAQLAMLTQYRDDYRLKQVKTHTQGAAGDRFRDLGVFMEKLEIALDQQRREVTAWRVRCEELRSEHHAAHNKVRKFETLRDARAVEARTLMQRRYARLDDQLASQAAARRNPPTANASETRH